MAAAHALALGGALVRRFCSCDPRGECGCGLKRTRSGWSVPALAELSLLMKQHGSVAAVALQTRRTVHDCNRALDELLGRSPTHALAVLEMQSARKWREARRKPARQRTA